MTVPTLKDTSIGLYLHIPYCTRKCPYCSFESEETAKIPEREYTDSLKTELKNVLKNEGIAKDTELCSIYFGGGTPSLFAPHLIGELIEAAKSSLSPASDIEVTLEVNPDSAKKNALKELKDVGVNRLSIGMQSLNDQELKELGRLHNARQAIEAFKDARAAGFENIGIDIICGAPGQTPESLSNTLKKVIELNPDHISVYGLTIEDDTPYGAAYKEGSLILPDEETDRALYLMAIDRLTAAGYGQYEISNLALPGMESRHNRRYWNGGDYIGLGASAHSFLGSSGWGKRWWNEKDAGEYIRLNGDRKSPRAGIEELTKDQAATEALMLGLRQTEGVDEEAFVKRFASSPKEHISRIDLLKEQGLICSKDGRLRLTREGILFSNEVF